MTVVCKICNNEYMPLEKAYNSKYCSKKCKNKAARLRLNPENKKRAAKRRYLKIKNNPER